MADKKSDEKKTKKKRGFAAWLVEKQRKEAKEIAETKAKYDAATTAYEAAGREAEKLPSAPNDALTLALLVAAIPIISYRLSSSDIGYSRDAPALDKLRDCLENFSGGSDQLVAVKSELLRLIKPDPFDGAVRMNDPKRKALRFVRMRSFDLLARLNGTDAVLLSHNDVRAAHQALSADEGKHVATHLSGLLWDADRDFRVDKLCNIPTVAPHITISDISWVLLVYDTEIAADTAIALFEHNCPVFEVCSLCLIFPCHCLFIC